MGGSNFQTGIIVLLALLVYGFSVWSIQDSTCYNDKLGNTLLDRGNETESSTSITQIIDIIAPINCPTIPFYIKIFFDVLFLSAIWYFLAPSILGTKIGRD